MSLAIGRQRAREGHSHVTAGRVIVVVSSEGGCEEGSWKEDGLDLFFRQMERAGGETKRRGGDGDVTVASSRAASQRIPHRATMTTSSLRYFLVSLGEAKLVR